jgi:hypothetical protein
MGLSYLEKNSKPDQASQRFRNLICEEIFFPILGPEHWFRLLMINARAPNI